IELILGGRAVYAGAHGVLIVLDDEHDRQLPQLGHVESLVDLALVGRAISEISEADAAIVLVLMGKGEAGADRHLGADDAVTTIKAMLDREHVHRAALPAADAGGAASQLGHHDLRIDSAGEHVAMIAIAR